ncbi:MAG: phosphotransferase, partial [Silvanigrellaceae bacterium]|nr:phosphotransferase [Silvanigrellaceae bacterium]
MNQPSPQTPAGLIELSFNDFQIWDNKETKPDNTTPMLVPIAGDASDKLMYRLINHHLQLICMSFQVWSGGFGGDPENWLAMQKALFTMDIPVPYLVGVDKKNFCIWIHDLGDEFIISKVKNNQLTKTTGKINTVLDYYKEALEILVKAQYPNHKIFHPALERHFDFEKLMSEIVFFIDKFLNKFLNLSVSLDKEEYAELNNEIKNIVHFLDSRQRVLCHRDYHSRNIMIYNRRVFWIDFQDARMGPHTYDVVSLLRDSYVNIDWEIRLSLFKYYKEILNKKRCELSLIPISEDDLDYEFMIMGLQRNIKA